MCVGVCGWLCHVRSYSLFQRPTAQRSCRRRAREVGCEFVGFVDVLAVSEQQPDLARKHVVPVVLVGKLRVVKEPRTGLGHLAEVEALYDDDGWEIYLCIVLFYILYYACALCMPPGVRQAPSLACVSAATC